MKLSERLKELRKMNGLTQKALADSLGLSISAIYSYESRRQVPSIQIIFDICKLYGVSADWLIGLDGKRNCHTVSSVIEIIESLESSLPGIASVESISPSGGYIDLTFWNDEIAQFFDGRKWFRIMNTVDPKADFYYYDWHKAKLKELNHPFDNRDSDNLSGEDAPDIPYPDGAISGSDLLKEVTP